MSQADRRATAGHTHQGEQMSSLVTTHIHLCRGIDRVKVSMEMHGDEVGNLSFRLTTGLDTHCVAFSDPPAVLLAMLERATIEVRRSIAEGRVEG